MVIISIRGRVVKALDLKSNGVSPRRFESCRMRTFSKAKFGWVKGSLSVRCGVRTHAIFRL